MYIEMCGKRGQGDKKVQSSILNNLKYNSSLCIVLEEIGFSRCQDDTIVDLRSNFEVFSPMEQLNYSLAKNIEDIDNEFINIFNKLFSKNGLVVIDIMDFELRNFFYEKLKNFYFKNLEVNKNNKIHFVYVKYAR